MDIENVKEMEKLLRKLRSIEDQLSNIVMFRDKRFPSDLKIYNTLVFLDKDDVSVISQSILTMLKNNKRGVLEKIKDLK